MNVMQRLDSYFNNIERRRKSQIFAAPRRSTFAVLDDSLTEQSVLELTDREASDLVQQLPLGWCIELLRS